MTGKAVLLPAAKLLPGQQCPFAAVSHCPALNTLQLDVGLKAHEEMRVDPTDGQKRTLMQFLLRHAVGADFAKGERLWQEARRTPCAIPTQRVVVQDSTPMPTVTPILTSTGWCDLERVESDGPPPLVAE